MARNAEQAGSSLKRRSPGVQARASGSAINLEINHMSDSNTSKSNVILFKFEARQVRTLLVAGEPWFFAMDVCAALDLADTNKALIGLDDDEKREHEQYSGSGRKPVLINESGLYSLILRSRKAEAKRFKKWLTAEVLPSIRRTGQYEDAGNKMATLVGDVIGTTGELVLDRVIDQKGGIIPAGLRRSFKHTMKSRLRSRFNVQKTALIPASELANACNFVAAYALEGEWLQASEKGVMQLTQRDVQGLYLLMSHHHFAAQQADKVGLYAIARMTDSKPLFCFLEHFRDAGIGFRCLDERREEIYSIYSQGGARGGYAMQAAS